MSAAAGLSDSPHPAVNGMPAVGQGLDVSPSLAVSAVQYEALPGGIEVNVGAHVRLVEEAHSQGARLVVFPELSLLGYDLNLLASDRPGPREPGSHWLVPADPRLERLCAVAARTGTTVVAGGALEEPDGTRRLASLVFSPDGSIRPVPKTHLHGAEDELFVPGAGPGFLEVDGWMVALAVCADVAHPSHAAAAASAGADLYAASALYVAGEEHRLGLHMGSRAMDHRMFSVLANLGGRTSLGDSCGLSGAWGPDGRQIRAAEGNGTAVSTATFHQEALASFRGGAPWRRSVLRGRPEPNLTGDTMLHSRIPRLTR